MNVDGHPPGRVRVIVVGAGPVGLMLAGELRLGGADVVVLERRAERSWESRGIGFTARAAELLDQRGLLTRLANAEPSRQGHFGGVPMDYGVLEGAHFGMRGVPQYRIEEMLETWAVELGAVVLRGREVIGLRNEGDQVIVTATGWAGTEELAAGFVVGCDGSRSAVRSFSGFAFLGSDAEREMYLADVTGAEIAPRMIGELLPEGMVMAAPLEDSYTRIIVCEHGVRPDRAREATFVDVADAWERLTGDSIHDGQARWVSKFSDATRLASQYRRGRVLLAGDAAHVHLPAGGQGMSVGIQDAVNLGWKLAATVAGDAPDALLDTYHSERHPVGARVLCNTRAQGTLNLSGNVVEPLRMVMSELMQLPVVTRHLAGMVSGFDIQYAVGDGSNPLLGMRMPPCDVQLDGGGRTQTPQLLHSARGVLLTDAEPVAREAAAWTHRVDIVRAAHAPSGSLSVAGGSVLLRPDGYVAWTGLDGGDLTTALGRWFGVGQFDEIESSQVTRPALTPNGDRL